MNNGFYGAKFLLLMMIFFLSSASFAEKDASAEATLRKTLKPAKICKEAKPFLSFSA